MTDAWAWAEKAWAETEVPKEDKKKNQLPKYMVGRAYRNTDGDVVPSRVRYHRAINARQAFEKHLKGGDPYDKEDVYMVIGMTTRYITFYKQVITLPQPIRDIHRATIQDVP